MTIILEVHVGKYGATTHRLPYTSKRAATKALRAIESKMGQRFSNDPEKSRHRVSCRTGDATFLMEEVVTVRVLDTEDYRKAVAEEIAVENAERLRGVTQQAAIIAEAIKLATEATKAPTP